MNCLSVKLCLATALLFGIRIVVNAQNVITGRVIDELSQPMEFVNIVMLKEADSTFIAGATTQSDGSFCITKPNVKAFLKLTSIGYKSKTVNIEQDLSKIVMQEDSVFLKEVVVKGHRRAFEMGKEGMITNVSGTSLSKAGTLNDVLKYVPGLTATREGLQVFGKGEPIIYIDGRQVRDASELEKMNSADIKSIELIQNPGVKYDASARAVIKIRTVRPAGEGVGIGVKSSYWQSQNVDLKDQIDLTYYRKGLYAFGIYKFSKNDNLQLSEIEQTIVADTLWRQHNELETNISRRTHEITAGLNYDINDKHCIGVKYIAKITPFSKLHTKTSTIMKANDAHFETLYTDTYSDDDSKPSHNINAFYNGTIGGTSIDLNLDYLYNQNIANQKSIETNDKYSQEIVSQSKIRNSMFATKLVLGRQLFKGTIQVGIETIHNSRHDDYTLTGTNVVSNTYSKLNETQINPFAEYTKEQSFGKMNFGLRYEHVAFKYYNDGIYVKDQSHTFDNIFPYASVDTRIGKMILALSYSVKTKRPTYSQLSSNIFYINHFSLQTGSPDLKSEHIHDISLMGVWKFMQFMLSWQDNRNSIIHWDESVPNSSSITLLKYKNLSSIKSLSAMVAIAPNIGIWTPQLTLALRKQWLNLDTPQKVINLNKPIVQIAFNNNLSLPWGIDANFDMTYQSKGNHQNIAIERNSYTLNVYFTKSFFNDALNIKLEGNDLFYQDKNQIHMFSNRMDINQYNKYDSREVGITISYKLNTSRSKYKGTGAGNAEKERM